MPENPNPKQTAPSNGGVEPSIIEIIQSMVRQGDGEEKILQTLQQLGVDPQKAQRLLLLAQADTFALLQSEISKIVKKDVEAEKQNIDAFVKEQATAAVKNAKTELSNEIKTDFSSYENRVRNEQRSFETQAVETVQKFTDLTERIRIRVNELGKDVQQIKVDQDEMKLRGIGTQNRLVSFLLLGVGILFVLAALGIFVFNFGLALSIDSIIIFIIVASVGVTAMFVSTLV